MQIATELQKTAIIKNGNPDTHQLQKYSQNSNGNATVRELVKAQLTKNEKITIEQKFTMIFMKETGIADSTRFVIKMLLQCIEADGFTKEHVDLAINDFLRDFQYYDKFTVADFYKYLLRNDIKLHTEQEINKMRESDPDIWQKVVGYKVNGIRKFITESGVDLTKYGYERVYVGWEKKEPYSVVSVENLKSEYEKEIGNEISKLPESEQKKFDVLGKYLELNSRVIELELKVKKQLEEIQKKSNLIKDLVEKINQLQEEKL